MFKLQPNPTFKATADIPAPGGTTERLVVIYRAKGRKAFNEFVESLKGREDIDGLGEIIAGWEGAEAEFSTDALAQVLDAYPLAAKALYATYFAALFLEAEKNG